MKFQSAAPTVVKSIKQRDLLNTWLRLYARDNRVPRFDEYKPERIDDERPDLVQYAIDTSQEPPQVTILSDGTRMSNAYGNTGKNRLLNDYLGPRMAPTIMPIYYHCIACALPVYTISLIDDIYGRTVNYERLLMPFSTAGRVTEIVASLKTISEDGNFEIRDLMRANDALPKRLLCATIDQNLYHRTPGRIADGDVIEFS